MATKITSSGLTYGHFECVYKRDAEEGLKTLCKTKTNGKERVTKQKKHHRRNNKTFSINCI